MKKAQYWKNIAKYAGIAAILFVLLFPVYWMVNCSLLPSNVIMSVPPRFLPILRSLPRRARQLRCCVPNRRWSCP